MSKNKSVWYAILVMLLWGSLFPIVKSGYAPYGISTLGDILFFAGVRFTICGLIICLYTLIKNPSSFLNAKKALFYVLMSGMFAIVLHYGFTYSALKLTDSSKTAILKQVGVLFYVCFSSFFFKDDKLTLKKLIGVIMGFLGIIVINLSSKGVRFNIGDVLIIAASFCTVFSNVISKRIFKTINPVTATGISQLFGGIVLLIAGKIMGGNMCFAFDSSAWIMMYICFASVVSYCIWFTVVKNAELSKLFIIKFAESIFACIFGAIILKENVFNMQYILSFLLIAGGIYISNKGEN